MKLTTEPGALAAAVKFAARALTARTAYPILGGLKITASPGGAVEVSAFDHQTSARARIDADVGEPGTVLAPGRLLADIAAQLPRQSAELDDGEAGLTLTCGSTRYTLHLLPLEDYPALPELPPPAGQADPGEFTAAVSQVVIAASRDDTLPALGAVQISFTPGALTLAATDRYRAALRTMAWQPADSGTLPPPVLIPAAALTEAARAAGDSPVALHIITAPDGTPVIAGFGCGDQAVTTRLTTGEYPDIAKLIPAAFTAAAVTGTEELAGAIKRLAVVAARDTPVHLAFTPGQIELTAGSGDDANGHDTIACELDGDPITVAFHPRRLLDAITSTSTGRTRIALTTPTKPALITPADHDDDPGDQPGRYRHLLVPIRCAG
jgi:DNA polymerase-3 subunit beta